MKITVVGTGYVGLVTGACLAEMGNHVVCLDLDPGRIATLLRGELPIHEPGLLDIVLHNTRSGRLAFTRDVDHAVAHGRVQFIAVGTPADKMARPTCSMCLPQRAPLPNACRSPGSSSIRAPCP